MIKNLTVVADWVGDTLSHKEFTSALFGEIVEPGSPRIDFIATSQNTVHSGFVLSQVIETEERKGRPEENVIFLNSNPRTDGIAPEGADGLICVLQSKLVVIGPNNGYSFSLIKGKVWQAFTYPGGIKKGQFSSRDAYPPLLARFMESKEQELQLEEVSRDIIPALEGHYVGYIDTFGNIKTTVPKSALKGHENPVKRVTIHEVTHEARVVDKLFSGQVNELVIAPGSSGPQDDPYLELCIRLGSAAKLFNNPMPGNTITIL